MQNKLENRFVNITQAGSQFLKLKMWAVKPRLPALGAMGFYVVSRKDLLYGRLWKAIQVAQAFQECSFQAFSNMIFTESEKNRCRGQNMVTGKG